MSVKSVLWWGANVDRTVISNCPEIDQNRYYSLGATMFIAASLAAISFSYAVFLFLAPVTGGINNPFAVIAAALTAPIWASFIFHIDRTIISSINQHDALLVKIKKVMPRLVLSIIVSVSVAHPLMLFLLSEDILNNYRSEKHDEIMAEKKAEIDRVDKFIEKSLIDLDDESEYRNSLNDDKLIQSQKNRKKEIDQDLEELRKQLSHVTETLGCEINGGVGDPCKGYVVSGSPKFGKMAQHRVDEKAIYQKSIENLERERSDIDNHLRLAKEESDKRIQSIKDGIKEQETNKRELERSIDTSVFAEVERISFFQRSLQFVKLLEKENSGHMMAIMIGIFLVLAGIELSPVLMKIIFPVGEYEKQLELRALEHDHLFDVLRTNQEQFSESTKNLFEYSNLMDRVKEYINELEELIINKMKELDRKLIDGEIDVDLIQKEHPHARLLYSIAGSYRNDLNGKQLVYVDNHHLQEKENTTYIEPEINKPDNKIQEGQASQPVAEVKDEGGGSIITKRDLYSLVAATIFTLGAWLVIMSLDSNNMTFTQTAQFLGACWLGIFTVLEGIFWRRK